MTDKLYIIIPAYNEEANLAKVAKEWHAVVEKISPESRLVIINDGSRDNTAQVLESLRSELPQLTALTKANSGHGATLLYGYNYALAQNADFIFQTDSDGQTIPEEFWPFWAQRQQFAALIGSRHKRADGFSRVIVTKTLKFILWCIFGANIPDANTPFRLLNRAVLAKYIAKIPPDFNLTNVLLTVCLIKYKEPVKFIPITFRPRQGGTNSINLSKISKIGLQAVKDFWRLKTTLSANVK